MMTSPGARGATRVRSSISWTTGAALTQLSYLVWLPLMFAFGYLLGGIFGYEPGTLQPVGFGAMAANVLTALLLIPLPSWIGVGLANHARRLGGGAAATAALVVCALTGVLLVVISLPLNGV